MVSFANRLQRWHRFEKERKNKGEAYKDHLCAIWLLLRMVINLSCHPDITVPVDWA